MWVGKSILTCSLLCMEYEYWDRLVLFAIGVCPVFGFFDYL